MTTPSLSLLLPPLLPSSTAWPGSQLIPSEHSCLQTPVRWVFHRAPSVTMWVSQWLTQSVLHGRKTHLIIQDTWDLWQMMSFQNQGFLLFKTGMLLPSYHPFGSWPPVICIILIEYCLSPLPQCELFCAGTLWYESFHQCLIWFLGWL